MVKKNKKNKKEKTWESVRVEIPAEQPVKVEEPIPEPIPEPAPPIPDDAKELWVKEDFDDRGQMVSLFNGLVKRGYTVDAQWEKNQGGTYKVVYRIKKAV